MVETVVQTMSERLVAVVEDIKRPLPPTVAEKAKMCLLDFLAAAFGGAESETAKIGQTVSTFLGSGNTTLIGAEVKGSALGAAFYNGLIGHAEELDDAHRYASGLHLGATIFPALLAVSENRDIDGRIFLAAAVAGYEVASRICRSIDAGHRQRGFHSTGTVGPFGACTAAGVAMRLGPEVFTNALGIVGSTGAGLFAFLEEGATVKHMHTGRAAFDGMLSALLAENGMTGPRKILEAKEGFLRAYASGMDPSPIIRPLEDAYEISFAYHKIHSACGHSFPAIDAALALRKEIRDPLDAIERIDVGTYGPAAVLDRIRPQSISEARFSIPFLVGLALSKGRVGRAELTPENFQDPLLLKIAACVSVSLDKEMADSFPKFRAAKLTVRMKDGRTLTHRIDAPLGMPDNPVQMKDIEQKFYACTEGIIASDRQEEIIERVHRIEEIAFMPQFTMLLGKNRTR